MIVLLVGRNVEVKTQIFSLELEPPANFKANLRRLVKILSFIPTFYERAASPLLTFFNRLLFRQV